MSKKSILLESLQLCGTEKKVEVFSKGTIFDCSNDHIILTTSGVLHLEQVGNTESIITYLNGEYLLDLSHILQHNNQKYQLVSDTNIEVIQLSKEDFKKLTMEKPSFIEWLIDSIAAVTNKIMTEFSKKHYGSISKIKRSISNLYAEGILKPSDKNKEWYEMPTFMSQMDLISYSNISRKTFRIKLKEFIEEKYFKVEKRKILIHYSFFKSEEA